MNTKNNKRRRESMEKIEKAFVELLQERELKEITVSDICKKADVNRTTFYSHYDGIEELNASIFKWMVEQFLNIFSEESENREHSFDFLKLFKNIKENQIFYKLYFKLGLNFIHSGE